MRQLLKNAGGFTLIELMLAMSLFSLVMVIATVGFIGMSRTFNRGSVQKDLSERAQFIYESVSGDIRMQGGESIPLNCREGVPTEGCPAGWSAVCLGQARYIWRSSGANTDLRRDSAPCAQTEASSGASLLGSKYKALAFEVERLPEKNALYRMRGMFVSGGEIDGILQYNPANPYEATCLGTATLGSRMCALEKFNFIVHARGEE